MARTFRVGRGWSSSNDEADATDAAAVAPSKRLSIVIVVTKRVNAVWNFMMERWKEKNKNGEGESCIV